LGGVGNVTDVFDLVELTAGKRYDIVYADPAWKHYGDPDKNAACGKHFKCITLKKLEALPVKEIMMPKSVLFCWVTCPQAFQQMSVISKWGLHFRGIPYIWVKTRKDGKLINGQGVPPTFVKPTSELLTAWTTNKHGRPFPILDLSQAQVQPHPRQGRYGRKPPIIRGLLVELCGERPRIELFARERVEGWDAIGFEV
jgi:N6-adenosine-specific RNA methylase IME4